MFWSPRNANTSYLYTALLLLQLRDGVFWSITIAKTGYLYTALLLLQFWHAMFWSPGNANTSYLHTALLLLQFWDAAGAAVALNRTLIFPTFTCFCDELWPWSMEYRPAYKCRWPGAKNQTLPFACPHDQLVNYLQLDDDPSRYGAAVRYRESTFLDNPRTPETTKVS